MNGSPRPAPLRLALVADAPLVLAGLRASLGARADCTVVATATSLEALADLQRRAAPQADAGLDVAIVDGGSAGSAALRRLDAHALLDPRRPGAPRACVLLAEPQQAALAGWLRAGLSVVPRHATEAQIVAAAHAAAAGLVALPPEWLAREVPLLPRSADADGALVEPLSPREREVLARMAAGLGNREIAAALAISAHTAKFHVAQILAKLQAASRTEAVVKGLRYGLVDGAPGGAAETAPSALA